MSAVEDLVFLPHDNSFECEFLNFLQGDKVKYVEHDFSHYVQQAGFSYAENLIDDYYVFANPAKMEVYGHYIQMPRAYEALAFLHTGVSDESNYDVKLVSCVDGNQRKGTYLQIMAGCGDILFEVNWSPYDLNPGWLMEAGHYIQLAQVKLEVPHFHHQHFGNGTYLDEVVLHNDKFVQ